MAELTADGDLTDDCVRFGADAVREAPYRPSYVDRLVGIVQRSRWSSAGVYGVLASAFVGAEVAVLAANGTFPDDFQFMHVMLPVYAMLVLPSFHYRNAVAAHALDSTRPLLRLDDEGYQELRYRLTTLPAGRSLVSAVAGLGMLAVLLFLRPAGSDEALGLSTSPAAAALEWVLQVLTWTGVGITTYHLLHQMRVVSHTYAHQVTINLFTPGPLYAFSRLTAANALFTMATVSIASLALAPQNELQSSAVTTPQWIAVVALVLVLAAASFVAPLWGAHQRLVAEKSRQTDALGQRVENAIATIEARVDAGEFVSAAEITSVLEGLESAQATLRRVSTWPWELETVRFVATGLVIPIAIWAITNGLDKLAS